MKAVSFIALFLAFFYIGKAQNQTDVTTLKNEVEKASNDSVKLEAYRKIYKYYEYTYPDSALYYLNKGHDFFRKRGYKRGIAFMLTMQAHVFETRGMDDWARKKYNDCLAMFAELNDAEGLAGAYNGLGMLEGKAGNFDTSTKYFHKALKLYERTGNTNAIVSSYINLGKVSSMAEFFDIALNYYNKALNILNGQPLRPNTVQLYNNIGATYAQQEMYDSALYYFQKSLTLCKQEGLTLLYISPYTNIGNVYRIQGNTDVAIKYFDSALVITKKEGSPEEQIRLGLSIAKIRAETNPKQSAKELTVLLDSAVSTGQKLLELEVLSTLIEVYKLNGDYKEAMRYVQRNTELSDSLYNIQRAELLQSMEMAYETDKANEKIKQLEISEAISNRNKNISIIVAILLSGLLVGITLLYKKSRALNLQLSRSNGDKDRLFSIIGHDLRAPVANIPMVVDLCKDDLVSEEEKKFLLESLKKNAEATIETLEKLLSWGKSHIKNSKLNPTTFAVSESLQNNIGLLKGSAYQKNILLVNNVADDVVITAEEEHFRFVMRNLLSNALKFTNSGGRITIDADTQSKAGYVLFSVKDNGVGISKDKQKNIFSAFNESTPGTENEMGTGLGLMLCAKFVKENGGEIWVESEEGKGTTFYFTFKAA